LLLLGTWKVESFGQAPQQLLANTARFEQLANCTANCKAPKDNKNKNNHSQQQEQQLRKQATTTRASQQQQQQQSSSSSNRAAAAATY